MSDKESQKKQIGELLKAADRSIKNAEWAKALEEVNKALAVEPNNMYAMAYKDRINVSIAEEKKKAEEEKVKKLADDKKGQEKAPAKPPEPSAEMKQPEPEKPAEPPAAEASAASKPVVKEDPAPKGKDDSSARIESLRQEYAATQAKLQRDVAQLTLQVKEAQALKEAMEKKLSAQLADLQKELTAAKQQSNQAGAKGAEQSAKEIETLKEKHKKEIASAREVAAAESLAQIATLQKEIESLKKASASASIEKQGEEILRAIFQEAWKSGIITEDKRSILAALKLALKVSDAAYSELESGTKMDTYITALRDVWKDGAISTEESDYLQSLREKLGIPAEEHFKLEKQVRKELKK